ncbi:MAG: hypothetical protein OHK0029_11420 [Armatimonadaceae bacterium]
MTLSPSLNRRRLTWFLLTLALAAIAVSLFFPMWKGLRIPPVSPTAKAAAASTEEPEDDGTPVKPWVAPPFCYTYLPGETPYVLVWGKIGAKATVTVRPVRLRDWLEGTFDSSEVAPLATIPVRLPAPKPGDKTPVIDLDAPGARPLPYNHNGKKPNAYYRASQGVALPQLQPGSYVVTVTGANTLADSRPQRPRRASGNSNGQKDSTAVTSEILLLVTRTALTVQSAPNATLVRAVDLQTGEPLSGKELRVIRGNREVTRTTDATGVAVASRTEDGNSIQVLSDDPNNPVFYHGVYGYNSAQWQSDLLYFQTDRPLYRPGQTVQYKGVLRKRTEEGYAVVANQTVQVIITDPEGRDIKTTEVTTNEFGSFAGELPLSESVALGAYQVRFQAASNDDRYLNQYAQFTVAKYRKPEYLVSVQPTKAVTVAGDTFEAKVSARYYFGAPVAGAVVEYHVYARPDYWWWWRENPENVKLLADFPGVSEDGTPQYRNYGPGGYSGFFGRTSMPYGYGPRIATGTATTDENGNAKITVPAAFREDQKGVTRLRYAVEVTVRDSSRQEVAGSGEGEIVPSAVALTIRQDRYGAKVGEALKLHLNTQNALEKKGISQPVMLKVARHTWQRPSENSKNRSGKLVETVLQETTVTTDAAGKGVFTFKPSQAGNYVVTATTTDSKKRAVSTAVQFWMYDEKSAVPTENRQFTISADKKRYYPGDKAVLLLQTPTQTADLWLTVTGRTGTVSTRVRATNYGATVTLPLTKANTPNIQVMATYVQGKNTYAVSQTLLVSPKNYLLNVSVSTPVKEFTPGETAQYTIKTTDHTGKPVSAEVALSLTDASLLSLTADNTEDIQAFFWSPIYLPVQVGFSFTRLPVGNPQGELDSTPWMSYYSGGFPVSLGQPMMEGRFRGFSGGPGGFGGGGGGIVFASAAIPAAATERYALKSDLSNAGGPPAIRSDFRDSAFWSPRVVTDGSGTATVSIPLPDNLTTWQATAYAVTQDTQVGSGSGEVTTSLPMIARLEMPRFTTQGDVLTLSGVVHNYTDRPLTTQVRLTSNGPGLAVEGGGAIRTVTIPAQGEKRVDWLARGAQPGVTEVTLTAESSLAKDGMALPLPTFPYGSTETVASSGMLDADGIVKAFTLPEGFNGFREDLKVMVAPSLLSVALGGAQNLAQYPYGCIEQTLSKFVPNLVLDKLLRERNLTHPQREDLPKMAEKGLERVAMLQLKDGGWGFGNTADPYFTAITVEALYLAKQCGYAVDNDMFSRGIQALRQSTESLMVDGDADKSLQIAWNLQRKARALHSLSLVQPQETGKAITSLWARRQELETPALSLLIRAAIRLDQSEIVAQGLEELEKRAVKTAAGTYWKQKESYYIERDTLATAEAVRALLAADKNHPRIREGFRWLIAQRRGKGIWYTTNDTAAILYAVADYVRQFPAKPDALYGARIVLNGQTVETVRFTDRDLFQPEKVIQLKPEYLRGGRNEIAIQPLDRGDNPVYYAVNMRYFLPRPANTPIPSVVSGIRVERTYLKRVPKKPLNPKQNAGYYWRDDNWELVPFGKTAQPGDEIVVKLVVSSDAPIGYAVIEDFLPAGCEPADQIDADGSDTNFDRYGGYGWWGGWGRRETHDERIAFLGESLPRGKTVLTYRLRVVTPGTFSAAPAQAFAMYLPEIFGSAASDQLTVNED